MAKIISANSKLNDKIYVADSGVILEIETRIDLTDATTIEIHLKKPDATIVELTGTVSNLTRIIYTILPADINQVGTYTAHSYIESPIHASGKLGNKFEFTVYEKYSS